MTTHRTGWLKRKWIALLLWLLDLSRGVRTVQTYHLAPHGHDGNPGTLEYPWRTFDHAGRVMLPGDVTLVHTGDYDEGVTYANSGTSWTSTVCFAAAPFESVRLKPSVAANVLRLDGGQYIEFNGITYDGSAPTCTGAIVLMGTSRFIRFKSGHVVGGPSFGGCANVCGGESSEFLNLVIHGGGKGGGCGWACANAGWYSGGSNNLIEGCEFYDLSGEGLQVYNGGGGSSDNNIIKNNRFHHIARSGDPYGSARCVAVLIGCGRNNQLVNNSAWAIGMEGGVASNAAFVVYGAGTSGTKIFHNTASGNRDHGLYIDGASGTEVKNNILAAGSTGAPGFVDLGVGTSADHNLVDGDMHFVNASAGDFHLQSASPARGAGVFLPAVPLDADGVTRPQTPACGAYEFVAVTPPDPQPEPPDGDSFDLVLTGVFKGRVVRAHDRAVPHQW
jgi:parallel beta-helix repeat protein